MLSAEARRAMPRAACREVVRIVREVLWAVVVVRRADALVAPLLCFAAFRLRVAAAFLAAA
jgi:hypothetical protein